MTKRRSLLAVAALIVIVAALVAIWATMVFAKSPQETLDQRVYDVASQLKCPVCQGESVANSPALISQQMRAIIRQQLQAGKSEQQVIEYFRARYGDRILWSPPQRGFTLLAWIAPPAVLLLGALLVFFVLRGWSRSKRSEASQDDKNGQAAGEVDEEEMAQFEEQFKRELAEEDALFVGQDHLGKEAS